MTTIGVNGDFSGCGSSAGMTDEVTFGAAGHSTDIVADLGSCGQMLVTYNGKRVLAFGSGDPFDKALLKALGLPSDYGF
jgi:hypothetical protein